MGVQAQQVMPLQQAIAMLVEEGTPPDLRKAATATAA
jgi:hypothetical protein